MKDYYVYILASRKNGVLYTGVTGDLIQRIHEHKTGVIDGFTKKYHVHKLVYFEQTSDAYEAIRREKRIKKWNRDWKIQRIEEMNPDWNDLYDTLIL